MAADRLVGDLSALNDPWQPAVLRLAAMAGEAGAATGKPVGVCGEAAADPLLAIVLVGLGARVFRCHHDPWPASRTGSAGSHSRSARGSSPGTRCNQCT